MEERFFDEATKVAQNSLCLRRKCGSVVVKDGTVIGKGYNAPPRDNLKIRRCQVPVDKLAKYPTDKTCCIHAEQRAVLDALRNYPDKLLGSEVYYVSVDEKGEPQFTGEPYCTLCSKIMLDAGVETFYLWHREGIKGYNTNDYNNLSFASNSKATITKDGR